MKKQNTFQKSGFTLVEIMIVITIIGILAALAVPGFQRVKSSAQNARLINDFRIFASAFQTYNMEKGVYPPDGAFDEYPEGMSEYLGGKWVEPPVGGQWIWDQGDWGVTAAVSYRNSNISVEQLTAFDEKYDDGDLASGHYQRLTGDRYSYIIEF